ncbi:MAG TPA: A/G-specific adenine glycosylase [Longimicrobiales bacterium]
MDPRPLRARLLAWYDGQARDLPWRRDPTPYATLVSEVMLQQTRVETVIPYFERWLARFPDIDALAASSEDDVLRAWEGLGYYSRARNLHGAARVVRERYDGALPSDYDALRSLPGIGEYTAGAVASIAFGRVEPAVDGNVRRVLSRVLDLDAPDARTLREHAARLIDDARPGDFNQALMELGATICTPRSPACVDCPIESLCLARQRGTVALRPAQRKRKAIPGYDLVTVVVLEGDRLLLRRRPERGMLAGMWEFPSTELRAGDDAEDAARELATSLVGGSIRAVAPLAPVEHVFSHRRETYHPFVIHVADARAATSPCAFVARGDLADHAMPRAQRRIQAAALNAGPGRR